MKKSSIDQKEVRTTLLAAFVGTLVTLVLSPVAQTISFFFNEFLSRPVLSIEYIELLPKEKPIDISTVKLDELVQSNGYQLLQTKFVLTSDLTMFLKDSLSSNEELKSFKESIGRFIIVAERRKNVIDSLKNKLTLNLNEMQIRTILKNYFRVEYYYEKSVNSLRSILRLNVQSEDESLESTLKIASDIKSTLEKIKPSLGGSLKVKVSIFNRGGTDGLIRNIGDFRFENNTYSIPLKRTEPDEAPPKSMFESVAVTVMNPTEGSYRSTSVGKVEKNSMAEFWYEVDKLKISEDIANKLWNQLADSTEHHYSIVLFDHTNDKVEYPFSWNDSRNH